MAAEETIESLKKKISVLENRLSLYDQDGIVGGYYALNRIVNQHVKILNDFKLENEITQNPKDDKKYDRVKAIWEGLKGLITDLDTLKKELRLTGDEAQDSRKVPFIESVAVKRD